MEIKKLYKELKAVIVANHELMSDRRLAFWQGACWALATIDEDLVQDYILMTEEIDERLQ